MIFMLFLSKKNLKNYLPIFKNIETFPEKIHFFGVAQISLGKGWNLLVYLYTHAVFFFPEYPLISLILLCPLHPSDWRAAHIVSIRITYCKRQPFPHTIFRTSDLILTKLA